MGSVREHYIIPTGSGRKGFTVAGGWRSGVWLLYVTTCHSEEGSLFLKSDNK